MAWNGSTNVGGTTPAPKKPAKKSPGLTHGLIAGGAIVLIGVISLYFVTSEPDEPKVDKKASTQIAEVEPDIAPATNIVTVKKALTKEEERLREIKEIEDLFGANMPDGVRTHLYYLKNPPKVSMQVQSPNDFFVRTSERQIAATVFVDPGSFFLTQPTFDERFDQDFVNSLLDKIVIESGDSDEIKEKKQGMIEIKKEIADICKQEGRKPSEVLNEHAKTMYELGRYKELLADQLSEIRDNPDISDEDVQDAFRAANEMLEKKGLSAINVPKLTCRAIRLQRNQERAARKAAAESNHVTEE